MGYIVGMRCGNMNMSEDMANDKRGKKVCNDVKEKDYYRGSVVVFSYVCMMYTTEWIAYLLVFLLTLSLLLVLLSF